MKSEEESIRINTRISDLAKTVNEVLKLLHPRSTGLTSCPKCNGKGWYKIGSDEIRCMFCNDNNVFQADGVKKYYTGGYCRRDLPKLESPCYSQKWKESE